MIHYLISLLITAVGFFIGAQILEGVKIKNYVTAILIALVIAILNLTLGFVLKIVTLGILSLGVFTLFLDAILILVADWFLKDFDVKNFWWALGLAVIVTVTEMIGNTIL